MSDDWQACLEMGAENLLVNCGGCRSGQKLLLVYETEDDGYYDPALVDEVRRVADRLGLESRSYGVPLQRTVTDPDPELEAMIEGADCAVFLARLGDQIRFRSKGASANQVISYALDRTSLASPFGTVDYRAFERIKDMVNRKLAAAREIHVTCPAGTDFKGAAPEFAKAGGDVTRKRFPVAIFTPVPADGFCGHIAQTGFLTGTGSQYYTPYHRALKGTLTVTFEGTRIVGFDGLDEDVAAAREHYEFVGSKYGIDTYHVHSWHAGIHPGCAYDAPAAQHFERWSGSAFGNPRLLHFHTCGAYPPGEISLNVLDPTVRVDGIPIWEDGRLHPERLTGGDALFDAFPEVVDVFRHPATRVGQGKDGTLSCD